MFFWLCLCMFFTCQSIKSIKYTGICITFDLCRDVLCQTAICHHLWQHPGEALRTDLGDFQTVHLRQTDLVIAKREKNLFSTCSHSFYQTIHWMAIGLNLFIRLLSCFHRAVAMHNTHLFSPQLTLWTIRRSGKAFLFEIGFVKMRKCAGIFHCVTLWL